MKDIGDLELDNRSIAQATMLRDESHKNNDAVYTAVGRAFVNPLPCIRCNRIGSKRCSVCRAVYCTKNCQEDDWYYHQERCRPPPPLENDDSITGLRCNENVGLHAATATPMSAPVGQPLTSCFPDMAPTLHHGFVKEYSEVPIDKPFITYSQRESGTKPVSVGGKTVTFGCTSVVQETERQGTNRTSNEIVSLNTSLDKRLHLQSSKTSLESDRVNSAESLQHPSAVVSKSASTDSVGSSSVKPKILKNPSLKSLVSPEHIKKFLRNQLKSITVEVGKEYEILLTWIIMEDLGLWLHINSEEYGNMLQKINSATEEHCRTAVIPETPMTGELICALDETDGSWYRGEIISATDNKYYVHFLDYGNTDYVAKKNLRAFHSSLLLFPVLCLHVKPIGAHDCREQAEIIFQSHLQKANLCLMEVVSLNPIRAFIKDSQGNHLLPIKKDIHKVCVEPSGTVPANKATTVVSDLIPAVNKPRFVHFDDCSALQLPLEKNVAVLILKVNSPTSIYVVPCDAAINELDSLCTSISDYCTSLSDTFYIPKLGELCLAKYSEDQQWYRAACLSEGQESAGVFFVDYGNMEHVEFRNVCQMTDAFANLPLMAVHCVLKGFLNENAPSRDNFIAQLKERLPEDSVQNINVTSFRIKDCCYEIEIPSIADIV